MTEAEWLTAEDPTAMLHALLYEDLPDAVPRPQEGVTDRKLRLFAVAACRTVWGKLIYPGSRKAVEVAEQYADGLVSEMVLAAADRDAMTAFSRHEGYPWPLFAAAWVADSSAHLLAQQLVKREGGWPDSWLDLAAGKRQRSAPPYAQLARLLREIFGNPWQAWFRWEPRTSPPAVLVRVDAFDRVVEECAWVQRKDVTQLARDAYQRSCFEDLPILADLLEDNGCTESQLLQHLRGPGPHVRGCWALDLLLGDQSSRMRETTSVP